MWIAGMKHQEEDRSFQTSWKRGREWLQLRCVARIIAATDAEPAKTLLKNTMQCSVCEASKVQCNFTGDGCTSFRQSTITRHEETAFHIAAMKAQKLSNDFTVCLNNNIMLEVTSTISHLYYHIDAQKRKGVRCPPFSDALFFFSDAQKRKGVRFPPLSSLVFLLFLTHWGISSM